MGSVEEDELVQMVKDFMESDSSPPAVSCSDTSNSHRIRFAALQEILRNGTQVEREVYERVLKYMGQQSKREVKTSGGDFLKKWLVMKLRVDGFNASLCHTSFVNSFCSMAGDYEYIDMVVTEAQIGIGSKRRVIVDTEFKSQFEVARPTQAYKQLIETLPPIFVGSEEKLNKIVSILCSAAKQSLREAGLHVPPWRTVSYMQSKWVSNKQPQAQNRDKKEDGARKIGNLSKLLVHPPDALVIKPKRRGLGDDGPSGSALSSQFSNLGINCC